MASLAGVVPSGTPLSEALPGEGSSGRALSVTEEDATSPNGDDSDAGSYMSEAKIEAHGRRPSVQPSSADDTDRPDRLVGHNTAVWPLSYNHLMKMK